VLEEDGIITAWLRVVPGQTGRFALIARSERWSTHEVVQAALSRLPKSKSVLCLVPDYDSGLASSLGSLGFEPVGGYATFARRLVKPVEELVAETSGRAVPVS
jgi:hypothetical protein